MNGIALLTKAGLFAQGLCLLSLLSPLFQAPADAASISGKLRVFVQPLSVGSPVKGAWKSQEAEFVRQQYRQMQRILTQKGIYEVVPEAEVRAALKGETVPGWKWKEDNWALARKVGRTLGADYTMIMERGYEGLLYWRMSLINLDTGRQFAVQDHIVAQSQPPEDYRELQKEAYRKIFQDAKGDMLATAIRKGRLISGEVGSPKTAAETGKPSPDIQPFPATSDGGEGKASAPVTPPQPAGATAKAGKSVESAGKAATDKIKLIVYDFEAASNLNVAGLILSEALREELHQVGRFILVNREDMVRVIEEYKLKQSGLLDGKGSAEIGKWLMAGEIVTGKIAQLGGSSILQVKRTDLQTMNTRAIGSLKCAAGMEEELLAGMSGLARRLAGSP